MPASPQQTTLKTLAGAKKIENGAKGRFGQRAMVDAHVAGIWLLTNLLLNLQEQICF